MISKDQLSAAMQRECDICVHLYTKFDQAGFDYRPTPGQRSTLELMQYLSHMPLSAMTAMRNADWSVFGPKAAEAARMPASEFPAAMQRQKTAIAEFFAGLTDEQLATQTAPMPGGRGESTLGHAIVMGPASWFPAYKLQLFLYAKQAGAASIGTSNAWRGADAEVKA